MAHPSRVANGQSSQATQAAETAVRRTLNRTITRRDRGSGRRVNANTQAREGGAVDHPLRAGGPVLAVWRSNPSGRDGVPRRSDSNARIIEATSSAVTQRRAELTRNTTSRAVDATIGGVTELAVVGNVQDYAVFTIVILPMATFPLDIPHFRNRQAFRSQQMRVVRPLLHSDLRGPLQSMRLLDLQSQRSPSANTLPGIYCRVGADRMQTAEELDLLCRRLQSSLNRAYQIERADQSILRYNVSHTTAWNPSDHVTDGDLR